MTANDVFLQFQERMTVLYRIFFVKKRNRRKIKLLKKNGAKVRKLSFNQKREVDRLFKGVGLYDYKTHELYYTVTGKFDPLIIPELLFRTKIELKLNKGDFKFAWDDKSYTDLFFPEMKMPNLIFRNISGVFYDKEFNVITDNDIIEYLKKTKFFVIKKSYDSGCGKGVQLVDTSKDDISDVLKAFKKDYIIQELFKQHELLDSFNKSSVNVIRYNSLLLYGRVIPLNASLRVGARGNFTDHSENKEENDSCIIGINKSGCLKDTAYHTNGLIANDDMQVKDFTGIKIPGFAEMTETILNVHKKLGYFGFIGWDFVVDEEGHAAVMEYNLNGSGILFYQYTNGPLFGKYTHEVLDYCKKKE